MVNFNSLPGGVSVHGLVFNPENKMLVIKRSESDPDEADCWDLPGGGLEMGENIEDGFLREVKEEAGISVKHIVVFAAHEVDDGGLDLLVHAASSESSVVLSKEHTDFKWVSEEELLTLGPASLHLRAVQELLKTSKRIITVQDTPGQ